MKKVVRNLLAKLKSELLVLDWKNRPQTRTAVKVAINHEPDVGLHETNDRRVYSDNCAQVFGHNFESYLGVGVSVNEGAA